MASWSQDRHHVRHRPTAVALVGLLLLLLLTGCGKALANTATVVVVLGSGTRNEPEPVLASPDLSLLRQAASDSSDAVAYVMNPNTGQARMVSLTPRRPDGQVEYGPRRPHLIALNLSLVQRLLSDDVSDTPFDLLSEMAEATRLASAHGTLIVLSSGLSVAGAFDLRQVGWGSDARGLAAALKRRGLLPDLRHWRVVFSGLGSTSGAQPPLPLPQRTELGSYWLAICHAAGALSCRLDEITRPEPPSRSMRPVPVVGVPTVVSIRGPHGTTGTIIPADTFFAFGQATLLPGADDILEPLAAKATALHLKVAVTGYASPDGGSATFNKRLSLRRAMAVSARLVALGVPADQITDVSGQGTAGAMARQCYRDGHVDETICARLRRVVITLSPASAASH